MKKFLIGLAVALVSILAAALIVPGFIDWNRYKPEIASFSRDITGREVTIDGSISFAVLPAPALSVDQVRLANLPGANSVDMLSLKSLEIRVAFLPLLRGEVRVEKIVLIEPEIELEILADGRRNWDFTEAEGVVLDSNDAAVGASSAGLANVRLDSFVIEGGRITYRDSAGGQVETIDNLNASVTAQSLRGPIDADGDFNYQGLPLAFRLSVGQMTEGRPLPLNLALRFTDSGAEASFSGSLKTYRPEQQLSGRFSLSGNDMAALIADLARVGDSTAAGGRIAALAKPFRVGAAVEVGQDAVSIDEIELQLGPDGAQLNATGSATVTLAETAEIDIKLAVTRVDLDALLAEAAPPFAAAANGDQGTGGDAAAQTPAVAPDGDEFSLPLGLRAKVDISVGALTYNEAVVRQIRIAAELADGALALTWATAQLPGSSDISVNGILRAVEGRPRFEGKVKAASNNLRVLLPWLGVDDSAVPPGRLTKIVLSGNLTVTDKVVQVYGLDMALDTARISGGLAYALRARPSFSIDLSVDRFNVDAYVPARPPEKAGDEGQEGGLQGAIAWLKSLPEIEGFDSNLKVHVARLTYRRTGMDDVDLDASLVGGILTVRNFSVRDIAGTSFALNGTGTNFSSSPAIRAALDLESENLAVLERLLDFELPVAAATLGAAKVVATIEGGLEGQLAVDADITLGDTTVRATGRVSELGATPRLNFTIDAASDGLATVIRQFDLDLAFPLPGSDRPVALKGTITGTSDSLDVNMALDLAGGRLTVAGNIAPTAVTPKYDLTLGLDHASLVACVRALGYDYEPASKRLGAVRIGAHVQRGPEGLAISNLSGNIGPVSIEGELNIRLSGAKPKLTAKLEIGELATDFFLEKKITGARQARAAGDEAARYRWSRKAMNLAYLSELDADIEISARRIAYGPYEFVVPRLSVQLADGTLEISQLTGKLFGGDVDIRAELKSGDNPSLTLAIGLRNASVEKGLRASADLGFATGVFDMTGNFSAAGVNQFAMVSALRGEARVTARDGIIKGIDLGTLNEGLGGITDKLGVLKLIGSGLDGGQTAYRTLSTRLVVRNGVARAEDTVFDIDGADASLSAVIDLPKWWIDAKVRFRLADHPDMPPLGKDIYGPLHDPDSTVLNEQFMAVIIERLTTAAFRKVIDEPTGGLRELLGIGGPRRTGDSQTAAGQDADAPTVKQDAKPDDPAQNLLKGILDQLKPKPDDE